MHDDQDILTAVHAFIDEQSSGPMVWGETDCTAWPAKWVESVTGINPLPMTWDSKEEAHAIIQMFGSLAQLWELALEDSHLLEGYGEPAAGDVGVIDTHLCDQVGGIFLAHRTFAWRAEGVGYRLLRPRLNAIVKFWRIK